MDLALLRGTPARSSLHAEARLAVAACLLLGATLAGCGGAVLPRRVTTRGFIAEPLEVLDAASGLAAFGRQGFRIEAGTQLVLDSVNIWRPLEAPAGEIAPEELEAIAYEMREAIGDALEEDFAVVRVPAPDALKVRLAIAEEASAWIVFEHLGTTLASESRFDDEARPSPALQALLSKALLQVVIAGGKSGEETLAAGQARILPPRQPGTEPPTWGEVRQACLGLAALLRDGLTRERGARRAEAPSGGAEPSGGGDR